MAGEDRLVYDIEGRVTQLEKAMARARKVANDGMGDIERRGKKSAEALDKHFAGAASRIGTSLKGIGAAFAGGLIGGTSVAGLQQIAGAVRDVANSVAMIGSQAKMAGLSTKAFQELSYVAEQNRISVDALADGMKELQLRADEFIVSAGKSGSGAEAFQRLGYSVDDLKTKLQDPSALLVDIIARMEQLDRAAQIRISDELFGGTAGERFVELLDRGASGIRSMIKEANEFGLILDEGMIAKADEIDRKFNLISKTIGTRVKGAIVRMSGDVLAFMDRMQEFEEQQSVTLNSQLSSLGMKRLENENEILRLRAEKEDSIGILGPAFDRSIEKLEKANQEISATEKRILDVLDTRSKDVGDSAAEAVPDITKLNTALQGTQPATDAAAKGMKSYADAIRALKGEIPELAEEVANLDARAKIDKAYRAALSNARSVGEANQAYALRQQALAAIGKEKPAQLPKVMDNSDEAKEKARQQIEAYSAIVADAQEFITSQQQEATALGMSADAAAAFRNEMDMLNQAKRDGLDLTDKQRQEIRQYAQGMAHAEKSTRQLAQSQEDAAELSRFFGESAVDALTGIATGTTTALDALRQLLAQLVRMAFQAAFLGEGPLAGSLKGTGGLFGSIGKPVSPSSGASSPVSVTPAVSATPTTEQTFAAPLGTVERVALPAVSTPDLGLRGPLGIDGADLAKTVQPAMQDAASSFAKSITLTPKEITDLKKTLMTEWVPGQGDAQGKGIIDTILNRKASGKWGDTVTDVVNARKQFSDINGPPGWKKGKRSVDDWSTSDPRYTRASRLVDSYLPERAAGAPSMVGDHLNYANREQSDAVNHRWIDKLDGPKLGAHRHGTTTDLQKYRPGEYGINLPGQANTMLAGTPAVDTMTTGSTVQQQLAAQQEQIVQQQIEAQRRLQQQMQATATSTTAMQQPLQGIGIAATQAVPQIGGMAQGVTGLIGPLASAVPGLGQFGGAIQSLLSQLLSSPMGGGAGLLGGLLGFAGGGEISGPGTGTSDSIPILASDGEFMVNAKATKKHRAVLEAINSGKAPAFATGGLVSRDAFSNYFTNSPRITVNAGGSSGNPKQDARFAGQIASAVGDALKATQADSFRRSDTQKMAQLAVDLRGAGGRNT